MVASGQHLGEHLDETWERHIYTEYIYALTIKPRPVSRAHTPRSSPSTRTAHFAQFSGASSRALGRWSMLNSI